MLGSSGLTTRKMADFALAEVFAFSTGKFMGFEEGRGVRADWHLGCCRAAVNGRKYEGAPPAYSLRKSNLPKD